jgi:hypothetical protein
MKKRETRKKVSAVLQTQTDDNDMERQDICLTSRLLTTCVGNNYGSRPRHYQDQKLFIDPQRFCVIQTRNTHCYEINMLLLCQTHVPKSK